MGQGQDWSSKIIAAKSSERIKTAKKQFHQWKPLRIYTTIAEVNKHGSEEIKRNGQSSMRFSVRFDGQEVAELSVSDKKPVSLKFTKAHISTNAKYFDYTASGEKDKESESVSLAWDSYAARSFRKHFVDVHRGTKRLSEPLHSAEHKVESTMIQEMEKKTGFKAGKKLLRIQPVKIDNIPFQMPMPLSANKGFKSLSDQTEEPKKGNIDIVARRKGEDNKIRISIWELKKPETLVNAVEQAVIYATTMLLMLRDKKCGKNWYEILEFNRTLPSKLEIEAVVAVTKDIFDKILTKSSMVSPLMVNEDSIRLYAACYEKESSRIVDFREIRK